MEFLKTSLIFFILLFSAHAGWASTCAPHLANASNDKLLVEVDKLNPEIIKSESKSPEQIYIDLKTEESAWYKNTYLDHNKKVTPEQKQRILDHYKLDLTRLETEYDFSLFYVNQLRLLYVRASNFIYERILSASLGSVVSPKTKGYAKHIINSFFNYELTSVEMQTELFNKTMKDAPWLFFPWQEMVKITTAWEAQPAKGPRELDIFIHDLKIEYEGKMDPAQLSKITDSLRARDAIKPICCKSGIGCQNCPLNRRFLL